MPIHSDIERFAGRADRSVERRAAFGSLEPAAPGPDGALRAAPARMPSAASGAVALLLLCGAVSLLVVGLGEIWLALRSPTALSGREVYDFVLDTLGSLAIAVAALELSRRAWTAGRDAGSE